MITGLNKLCGRTNAFTFLFYPDPDNDITSDFLFEFLNSCQVPSCVSPLHDQDIDYVDVSTGEAIMKKAHYHVVIDYGSGKTVSPVQLFDLLYPIRDYIGIAPVDRLTSDDDTTKINNTCRAFKCNNQVKNMRSVLRYFKHLDQIHRKYDNLH